MYFIKTPFFHELSVKISVSPIFAHACSITSLRLSEKNANELFLVKLISAPKKMEHMSYYSRYSFRYA